MRSWEDAEKKLPPALAAKLGAARDLIAKGHILDLMHAEMQRWPG